MKLLNAKPGEALRCKRFGKLQPQIFAAFEDGKVTAKVPAYHKPSGQPIAAFWTAYRTAIGTAYRKPLTQPNALNLYAFILY